MAGPCPWTINTACCPAWATYTPEQQEVGTVWATEILWALSGRQFGLCQVTVRPCEPCHPRSYVTYPVYLDSPWGGGGGGWLPYVNDGQWFNCACPGQCCCDPGCRVALQGPVGAIIGVWIDGVLVPDTDYRVVDNMWLVRTPGTGCWPECQQLAEPDFSTNHTFTVQYTRGTPLPAAGAIAAGVLACSIAARCAAGDCTVPFNITSLTREGVTVQIGESTVVGATGIKIVDDWVQTVNPGGLQQRPSVYNPDLPAPEMTTWTA